MAEKKQHTIVSAKDGKPTTAAPKTPKTGAPKAVVSDAAKGAAKSKRVLAWVLWVIAFAFEVLAFLIFAGKLDVGFINRNQVLWLIVALALDLGCVILGAQFWKQANHMDPISEANKTKFWLHNNMGVIVCCFAFIPFIILALKQKDADPKLKKIAVIAAAAALLIGGATSIDYNPVSQEGLAQAADTLSDVSVYWTAYGKKYHTHEDCQHLDRSDELVMGSIEDAIESGRSTICKTCAKRDGLEIGDNGAVIGTIEKTEVVEDILEEVVEEAVEEVPAA